MCLTAFVLLQQSPFNTNSLIDIQALIQIFYPPKPWQKTNRFFLSTFNPEGLIDTGFILTNPDTSYK